MSESLDSSGTNMARMITFLRAHKRLITFSLVAFGAFWLTPSWSEVGPLGFLFFFALFLMLIVSQIFWVGRVVDLGERFIPGKPRRAWLTAIASVVCLFFFAYNIGLYISPWKIPRGDSTHLTLRHVLFEAPFWWWFVGSWVGFGLVMVFWMVDRAGGAAAWVYRKARKVAAGHAAVSVDVVHHRLGDLLLHLGRRLTHGRVADRSGQVEQDVGDLYLCRRHPGVGTRQGAARGASRRPSGSTASARRTPATRAG